MLMLVSALALALAGCGDGGSDDTGIPPADAALLQAQLDKVAASVGAGECLTAREQARGFVNLVNDLPATAGQLVKQQLRRGGRQLTNIVLSPTECLPDTATPETDAVETPATPPDTGTPPAGTPPVPGDEPDREPEPGPENPPADDGENSPPPEEDTGGDHQAPGGGGALAAPVPGRTGS